VSDASLLDRLQELLPPGARLSRSPFVKMLFSLVAGGAGPRSGVRRYHLAYQAEMQLARTHDLEEALDRLARQVNVYIARWARRRIFVHAGAVAYRGRAILLPGGNGSGKSWLVRALVRAGAEYYSDELAALDARGRVHPYPLPLMIRDPDGRRVADEAGRRRGRRPLPIGLVALTRFAPGRRFRPRVLSSGRAVLELLSHTVPARRSPDRALEALSQVVAGATVVKGVRGEADAAGREILDEASRIRPEAAASEGVVVPEPLSAGGQ